jgi:hypothetical protein
MTVTVDDLLTDNFTRPRAGGPCARMPACPAS